MVIEAVGPHQGDAVSQPFLENRSQIPIKLAGHDLASSVQKRFGQGAGSGADFQHQVSLAHSRGLEQPTKLVLVMQEVLPERLLRMKAPVGEDRPDFTERLHDYQL